MMHAFTFWFVELLHLQRRSRVHCVRADVDGPTADVNNNDLVPRLEMRAENQFPELNGRKDVTSSNAPDFVSVMQKLKVASPSVTKETRERASSSVKMEALTTDFRRNSCWRPSHPLGCERMRWISDLTRSHILSPMGSDSLMNSLAESNI